MSKIVRVPLDELAIGMEVCKFDRSGFTYAYYGKPFPSESMRETLRGYGVQYAYINDRSADDEPPASDAAAETRKALHEYLRGRKAEPKNITPPTIKELSRAAEIHKEAKKVTSGLLQEARLGKMVNTSVAKDVVSSLVDQCVRSPEAFVNITRLKDFDNYTFTHSVNVSVLAIALGRRMGLNQQELNNLGFAGLLHDVGKMHIPENILNKPDKLTDTEYAVMKTHAVLGYEYLKNDPNICEDILFSVRYHHEKSDGTGYPDGLSEGKIPKFAKILSIADVYDAITTERVYHKGMTPNEAVHAIFSWSGKHFNNSLVKFFISIMGIYPVGTLVILDTNELAIIMEPNRDDPVRPAVLIISGADMAPMEPLLFELSKYNITTQRPYKSIVSSLDPKDFSINTNHIIEQFLRRGDAPVRQ